MNFSSAEKRIRNFKYKLELIEEKGLELSIIELELEDEQNEKKKKKTVEKPKKTETEIFLENFFMTETRKSDLKKKKVVY